jgi:hypothetical protein
LRILLEGQVLLRQHSSLQLPALEQRQSGIKKKSRTRVLARPDLEHDKMAALNSLTPGAGELPAFRQHSAGGGYADDEEETRCD